MGDDREAAAPGADERGGSSAARPASAAVRRASVEGRRDLMSTSFVASGTRKMPRKCFSASYCALSSGATTCAMCARSAAGYRASSPARSPIGSGCGS
jgi:hypothetical protein